MVGRISRSVKMLHPHLWQRDRSRPGPELIGWKPSEFGNDLRVKPEEMTCRELGNLAAVTAVTGLTGRETWNLAGRRWRFWYLSSTFADASSFLARYKTDYRRYSGELMVSFTCPPRQFAQCSFLNEIASPGRLR